MNDTGITLCGDYADGGSGTHNNDVDCTLTTETANGGDPVPAGQDGHHGFDVSHNDASDGKVGFSFTKLDANGADLPASAAAWACVRDNVTGLIWEAKTDANKSTSYTWPNANTYKTTVNTSGLCGASDWRLPTVVELQSIVDYSKASGPMIDMSYFKNTQNFAYWTVSSGASYSGSAWVVYLYDGSVNSYGKLSGYSVRLVREDSD